jgi:putative Mg2+ transporter-C (MgtC) family protein
MEWESQLLSVARVALAMLLGGLVGLEREMANRPAGFRTHMLVCGMAAMMVSLTDPLLDLVHLRGNGHVLNSDPIRVIEAIVAGVAFLGAGTIFRRQGGSHVEGLTTAASLLAVGAIGVAVGAHQYVFAAAITVLILVVLRGILLIERRGENRRPSAPPPEGDRKRSAHSR